MTDPSRGKPDSTGQRPLFSDYMEHFLYDPTAGFYGSGRGQAGGRRGDFITSPEVGPLFGAVMARALDQWWTEAGCPDHFPVVDLGAGPGGLIRSLELAAPACAAAWSLLGSDRSRGEAWPDVAGAVVIANELLDNVPFDMGIRSVEGDRLLVVGDMATDTPSPDWRVVEPLEVEVPLDLPFPLLDQAARLVEQLRASGARRIVAFDYGEPMTAALAERGGWLRTYRQHERGDDPFREPGEWDITTDLAVDQLPPPDRCTTQADFLIEHGIDLLVDEGRSYWATHAAAPDLTAMRMRSRVREADALLDRAGLGGFLCLEWIGPGQPGDRSMRAG